MNNAVPIEMVVKGEAEIAKMQPGDVLLIKFDGFLSIEQFARVRELVRRDLPDAVNTLIVDRNFSFSILRPPPGPADAEQQSD